MATSITSECILVCNGITFSHTFKHGAHTYRDIHNWVRNHLVPCCPTQCGRSHMTQHAYYRLTGWSTLWPSPRHILMSSPLSAGHRGTQDPLGHTRLIAYCTVACAGEPTVGTSARGAMFVSHNSVVKYVLGALLCPECLQDAIR